jgi:predicted hydrocarbon binding protein
MKGVVFIILNEMIEDQHGIDTWEIILNKVQPESEGIYIATESYADEEMVKYVQVISELLEVPTSAVTKLFGRHLFDELNSRYSVFTSQCDDYFEFLDSIENVIHKEVRKLYQQASLPTLDCEINNPKELLMQYHSPRQLCYLAEGLIQGAAEFYKETVSLTHECCMHDGADHCEIRITRE